MVIISLFLNRVISLEEGLRASNDIQESYSKLLEDSNRKFQELMQKKHTTLLQSLAQLKEADKSKGDDIMMKRLPRMRRRKKVLRI